MAATQINSANINVPGQNQRQINEVGGVSHVDTDQNEYNSVDITNSWREFSKDEWWRMLGKKGRMIVEAKRTKMAASRGSDHRGGCGGRGGRGGQGGRGGWGGRGDNLANNSDNRNVNGTNTADRDGNQSNGNGTGNGGNNSQNSVSTVTLSQASTNNERGGQNWRKPCLIRPLHLVIQLYETNESNS